MNSDWVPGFLTTGCFYQPFGGIFKFMRLLGRLVFACFIALAMATLMSCDAGVMLLSRSELDDLYTVTYESAEQALQYGTLLIPGQTVQAHLDMKAGANEPARVAFELLSSAGYAIHTMACRTVNFMGRAMAEDEKTLEILLGRLPAFELPDGLDDGYHSIIANIYDTDDALLSQSRLAILVYSGAMRDPSIQTVPSSPLAGKPVLFKVSHSGEDHLDPWVRWTVRGTLVKQGFISNHADRMAWTAPKYPGFYDIKVEVFPYWPAPEPSGATPVGQLQSPFSANHIVAVAVPPGTDPQPMMDRFIFLDFKKEPEVQDMRDSNGSSVMITPLSRPYPEIHPQGFGQALTSGGGYLLPGGVLPKEEQAFWLETTLLPISDGQMAGELASGTILSIQDTDSFAPLLKFGLEDAVPYISAGTGRIESYAGLTQGIARLVAEFVPVQEQAGWFLVTMFLNDVKAGSGTLSIVIDPEIMKVQTMIAGPGGLNAVFDSFGVNTGRYPEVMMAQFHEHGSDLVAASGFEGGSMGFGLNYRGRVDSEHRRATLAPQTSLETALPPSGFTLALDVLHGQLSIAFMVDSGSRIEITSDRMILRDGNTLLAPPVDPGIYSGILQCTVEQRDDSITISLDTGSVLRTPGKLSIDSRLSINAPGPKPAAIGSITVHKYRRPPTPIRVEVATLDT